MVWTTALFLLVAIANSKCEDTDRVRYFVRVDHDGNRLVERAFIATSYDSTTGEPEGASLGTDSGSSASWEL